MFSFKQVCEEMTCNQRHAWFYLNQELLNTLTVEEQSLIHVELLDDNLVRCFYPHEKYWTLMSKEAIQKLLVKAVEDGNTDEIIKLKRKMNEKTQQSSS